MSTPQIDRRTFLRNSALAAAGVLTEAVAAEAKIITGAGQTSHKTGNEGELLYNGIQLPPVWPPRDMERETYNPMPVPWLAHPPEIIPITLGRQLFVDDFLIAQTTLARKFHRPRKHPDNPVLKPETELETRNSLPVACPKSGGIWWDPADNQFKMWYEAGWLGSMAYATSADGLHWERPVLDGQSGTNRLVPGLQPDSTTVFLDHDAADPAQRFKMFLREPNRSGEASLKPGYSLVSADGIHWSEPSPTGGLGDRSTMFYNPFRRKWVYSIRSSGRLGLRKRGRARWYREHADFLRGAKWVDDDLVFWTGADALDPVDKAIGDKAQLYNLDAVAYESLMLGFFQILLGPSNQECGKGGFPKTTELMLAYSRDGFHWHRPDRSAFIEASRKEGDWERGYVQSVGGVGLVVGDELRFYYIGFRGDPANTNADWHKNGMYSHGATGLATLRRDGFASMSAGEQVGVITTRPVVFTGSHLFVNVNCPGGELRAELLDADGQVLPSYAAADCEPVEVDSTIHRVRWHGEPDLAAHAGQPVRLRFHLRRGDLYAFWVSPDSSGASHGYNAAGGPGFTGAKDTVGRAGYAAAVPTKSRP